jgi:ATP/maltotriose-dependent transcriptional regulator MalT
MTCDNNCGSCRYQLDPTHCADVVSGAVAAAENELDGLRVENERLRRERIEQEAMNLEIAGLIRKVERERDEIASAFVQSEARCAEILGFYSSTLVRLECVRGDLDEARAEVARRDALIKSDGYEDMRQHAQDLALQLEATRLDRDRALVRCREASEVLIAEIGAAGPENVEATARRAAERITALEKVALDSASQCDHCDPAIYIECLSQALRNLVNSVTATKTRDTIVLRDIGAALKVLRDGRS